MTCFARMDKLGGRSRRCQCRGDFAGDLTGFADAADDDAATNFGKDLNGLSEALVE